MSTTNPTMKNFLMTAAQYRVLDHHIVAILTDDTRDLKSEYTKLKSSIVFSGGWEKTRFEKRVLMSLRGPQILVAMMTILVNLPEDDTEKIDSLQALKNASWTSSTACRDEELEMPL